MNILQQLEHEHAAELALAREVPDFRPGDTLRVNVRVTEGERTRVQAYEGVCIARGGSGINESFTVRKISYGEGVERVFPVHSPVIESIEVRRRGKVRRAKLYYLRERRGKSARIPERQDARQQAARAAAKSEAHAQAKADARAATAPKFSRPSGPADDLTRITGIDATLAERLEKLGLVQYEQVANMSDDEIAQLDDAFGLDGVIERNDWTGRARELMAESTVDEVPAEDAADAASGDEDKPTA